MIIWITGASSGLGRELAVQCVRAGHTVSISARNVVALEELKAECAALSGQMHTLALDVTDATGVSSCFDRVIDATGMPDICVLNAGTHKPDAARSFNSEEVRRIMDINFMGTVNCLQAIIPEYLSAGRGKIAVISSVAGYRGLPNASAYGASKAALINMCESLQPELAGAGVALQLINPGFVRTPLTDKNEFPMPFLMEVEDAAASMLKGLESDRFEVTFPRRFTWLLKILRILPYSFYLRLTRNLLRDD